MIPIEKLHAIRTVVAHGYADGACPDGLASAMIVKDALPDIEVRFAAHGTPEYEEMTPEPGMLFVDIVPPRKRASEFLLANAVVLDHHKESRELVAVFAERGLGVFADEKTEPGVSGAVLAYRHVWNPLAKHKIVEDRLAHACRRLQRLPENAFDSDDDWMRRFADLVGIRDTWQKTSPLWEVACEQSAVLTFFPVEDWFDCKNPLAGTRFEQRLTLGPLLLKKRALNAKGLAESAYRFVTKTGLRVAVLGSKAISDAADLLLAAGEVDVAVGFAFHVRSDSVPVMQLSFRASTVRGRSRANVDVAAVARQLGGGGR